MLNFVQMWMKKTHLNSVVRQQKVEGVVMMCKQDINTDRCVWRMTNSFLRCRPFQDVWKATNGPPYMRDQTPCRLRTVCPIYEDSRTEAY